MLRDIIQGFTIMMLLGAVVMTVIVPPAWPFLLVSGVLAVGVFYERTLSRGAAAPLAAGWAQAAERFRDEESGAMVTVWFNSKTGERRYVEDGARAAD